MNSMIANLEKYRFLQQVQKNEHINWDWFGILLATWRKPPPETVTAIYCHETVFHILVSKLVPFTFTLILGDPLMPFLLWLH